MTSPLSDSSPAEDLSVVVVPLLGGAALSACLTAIERQPALEIIVVCREKPAGSGPWKVVEAPLMTVPERRRLGLELAQGPLVAFVEDTCTPSPGWTSELRQAFAAPNISAVGGPILVSAALPARRRALALSEYSRFSRSRTEASSHVRQISGANFALRRALFAGEFEQFGVVDNLILGVIHNAGGRAAFSNDACVTYVAAPAEHIRLTNRLQHGRIYGSMVAAGQPLIYRLVLAAAALLAPAVLIFRTLRHAGPQLFGSPLTLWWVVLMHCAWGCGEVIGKATGKAGASFGSWR